MFSTKHPKNPYPHPTILNYNNIQTTNSITNFSMKQLNVSMQNIYSKDDLMRYEAYHYLHSFIKSESSKIEAFSLLYSIIIVLINMDDLEEVLRIIIHLNIFKNSTLEIYRYLLFETPFYFILNNIHTKILSSKRIDKNLDKKFIKYLSESISYLLDISDLVEEKLNEFKRLLNQPNNRPNNKQNNRPNNKQNNRQNININNYLITLDNYIKCLFNAGNELSIINLSSIISSLLDSKNSVAIEYALKLLTELSENRKNLCRSLFKLDNKIFHKIKMALDNDNFPDWLRNYYTNYFKLN